MIEIFVKDLHDICSLLRLVSFEYILCVVSVVVDLYTEQYSEGEWICQGQTGVTGQAQGQVTTSHSILKL